MNVKINEETNWIMNAEMQWLEIDCVKVNYALNLRKSWKDEKHCTREVCWKRKQRPSMMNSIVK